MNTIKLICIAASVLFSVTIVAQAEERLSQDEIKNLYTENSLRLNNNVLCNDVESMAKALRAQNYKLGVLGRDSDDTSPSEIYIFVNSITGNYIITKTFHSKELDRDLTCIIAKGKEMFFNGNEEIAIKKLKTREDGDGADGWVKVVPSVKTFLINY